MGIIRNFWEDARASWSYYGADSMFRRHFMITIIGFLAFLRWGIELISSFESRQGRVLADPILEAMPPMDFSMPIFALIHSGIVITALLLLRRPARLLLGMQLCLAILVLRTVSLYLVPLEPPPGMILLEDPFISWVFGSEQQVAVKDLFFSGHVATMCALIYVSEGHWRTYLKVATLVVGVLIAWQHVHYSIDLLAAPFFALGSAKVLDYLHRNSEFGLLRSAYELELEDAR